MAVDIGPTHWPIAALAARAAIKECTLDGKVSHAAVLATLAVLTVTAAGVLKESPPRVLVALGALIRQAKIRLTTEPPEPGTEVVAEGESEDA